MSQAALAREEMGAMVKDEGAQMGLRVFAALWGAHWGLHFMMTPTYGPLCLLMSENSTARRCERARRRVVGAHTVRRVLDAAVGVVVASTIHDAVVLADMHLACIVHQVNCRCDLSATYLGSCGIQGNDLREMCQYSCGRFVLHSVPGSVGTGSSS